MLTFYHKKGIDMLELGCTQTLSIRRNRLRIVAKDSRRYGWWSFYRLRRKAVVDENFI